MRRVVAASPKRPSSAVLWAAPIAGTLLAAACSASPTATPPGTRGTPAEGTRPATTAPTSEVVVHLDERSGPGAPVAAPAQSPLYALRRDCGMSAPLSDGRTLWIYCDTAMFGEDQRLRFFVNTSAALAEPTAPTVMLDATNAEGQPTAFLEPTPGYPECTGTQKVSAWPASAVSIATGDRDRVLVWFINVCLQPGGAETHDVGVAELAYTPGQSPSTPLVARVLTQRLFPKGEGSDFYGAAATVEGDHVFLYACTDAAPPCTIARAPATQAAERTAYEFWDGRAWSPDIRDAAPITTGPRRARIKPSVHWVSALGMYVMADIDALNSVAVRVARHPEGPWSAPAVATLSECTDAYPDNCFAAEVQPQLSDATHVAISYFDPTRGYGTEPTTRVATVGLTLEPPTTQPG